MEQSHLARRTSSDIGGSARRTLVFFLLQAVLLGSSFAVLNHAIADPAGDTSTTLASGTATLTDGDRPPKAQEEEHGVEMLSTLAHFLAKKYRVSAEHTADMIKTAYAAGREVGLDPVLILAVIGVESSFNPFAEGASGAKGLMQVIPRYHMDKFREMGGKVLDPKTNILVGAKILKEYVASGGSVSRGLQMYGGGPASPAGKQYAGKVIAEKQRIEQVVRRPRDPS